MTLAGVLKGQNEFCIDDVVKMCQNNKILMSLDQIHQFTNVMAPELFPFCS